MVSLLIANASSSASARPLRVYSCVRERLNTALFGTEKPTFVEVQYGDAVIQIDPSVVGFELEIDSMIAAADLARTGDVFWLGYWNFLWNRDPEPVEIPLSATIDENRLTDYLQNEISARYDEPPTPAQPIPGSTSFTVGEPGRVLDIPRAVRLIEDALRSHNNRTVLLTFQQSSAARPTIANLEILLQQNILVSGFDGVIGLYLFDLQNGLPYWPSIFLRNPPKVVLSEVLPAITS
jgi:hypothetical protein